MMTVTELAKICKKLGIKPSFGVLYFRKNTIAYYNVTGIINDDYPCYIEAEPNFRITDYNDAFKYLNEKIIEIKKEEISIKIKNIENDFKPV